MSKRFSETAEAIKLSQAIQKLSGLKSGTVVPIPLEHIDRTDNIREGIDEDSIEFKQLIDSIKEVGLLQNPVVTIVSGRILCVSGHRRLAAMSKLEAEKVPCSVVHFDNLEKRDLSKVKLTFIFIFAWYQFVSGSPIFFSLILLHYFSQSYNYVFLSLD